jgi:hypothetical protein
VTPREALVALARAARKQGATKPYSHSAAMSVSGVRRLPFDEIQYIATRWARELPIGCATLHSYIERKKPTGVEAAEIFQAAADKMPA